jgi:hypothetical protein
LSHPAEEEFIMTKIAVVFQSGKALAEAVLAGVNEVEGVTGKIFEVRGRRSRKAASSAAN